MFRFRFYLIALALLLAALYSGYWFIGRAQVETRLHTALQDLDAGPYALRFDSLNTRGFPSRFDTTITNLRFEDPANGTAWAADPFQFFALSYRPNEVIALFPPEQTLTLNGQTVTLLTQDMRASGKVAANTALTFQNATVTMDTPRLQLADGAQYAMARLLAAMRLSPDTTDQYDVFFETELLSLPENLRRQIDPHDALPETIQHLRFDSDVTLNAPIALNGAEGTTPKITHLFVTEFALSWGDVSMVVIGEVTPDANGLLNGSVTLTARNWETLLDLAIAAGSLTEDQRSFAQTIGANIDETPHIDDTLTATLTITDGQMSLSGLPLGAAPTF